MAANKEKQFLANEQYDNDADLVGSDPETDSDDGRNSVRLGDEKVLQDADEQERLLRPQDKGSLGDLLQKNARREERRQRRARSCHRSVDRGRRDYVRNGRRFQRYQFPVVR